MQNANEEQSLPSRTAPPAVNSVELMEVYLLCIFRAKGVAEGPDENPNDALVVDGLPEPKIFHRQRLERHRAKVQDWLKTLPDCFREENGAAFIEAFGNDDRSSWTEYHENMTYLFYLAIGLGLMSARRMSGDLNTIFQEPPFVYRILDA
jgi:hypothetical protein